MIPTAAPPAAGTGVRTLQVGKGWFPEESGGLNRYYRDLLERLPAVGVRVAGLVAGTDRVAAGSGGTVEPFAPRDASLPVRLRAVRSAARRALGPNRDRLLVGHFALYVIPCLDLLHGDRFIVHFHGPWADESRAEGASPLAATIKHRLEQAVYRRAERLIVLSRAFGRVLERRYRVPADRIRVIPGGVDTKRFAPSVTRTTARAVLRWPADRPIALVVRRLVHRMGLADLLTGLLTAVAAVPDLLVMIAGTGPLAGPLEARAAALGLESHVRFLGFLSDERLPLAYRAADLSIVPSAALEGFGLVVAESLAAGTPVLVTPVGGLPETVEGLPADCVVAEPGPAALGDGIARALQGRLAMPSGDTCIRHARARFDWAVVGERIRAVYEEAAR